ncbi:MAG: beta-galactosidase trimerization domain-containing protein, partial [Phycisphaerae bacterium]
SERNLPQDRSFLHLARSQYWNDSTADFLRELWEMTRRIKPDAIFRHNAHERWPMNEIGNFKLSEDNRPCSYDPAGGAMWTNFGLWKYLFEDGGRQKPFVNGVRSKVDWAEINACGGDAPSIVDADYQAFHKKYGRQIYHNTQPLGRVAVMIRGLSPVAERAPFFTHLARHNVQFDVMIYEQADRYDWKLYSLIVLFDVRCMSDQIADRLRAFVSAGGNLIATGPSGLGTEHWLGRDEYALADVYGVSLREGPTGRLENRFGKGQVVFYPDSIGQKLQQGQADELCQRFIDDVRRLAGRAVLEIEAPDGVVATLMGRGRNKRIVHLINYRPEPIDGVVVRLPGWRFEQVELLSPDQPGPRLEQVGVDEQGLRFRVDGLAVYAVAVAGRR